ncbi:hypothetical protein EVAR_77701_1 [Eumeta japonica]|uniref:Uncharacterized protein n=1 Tax=Eumeta variegata TaxID=151549 RepID=A0A4C1TE24_EUMVA|nr:hypothetical protein EVAR_77701_1 [Eumeta japonica]
MVKIKPKPMGLKAMLKQCDITTLRMVTDRDAISRIQPSSRRNHMKTSPEFKSRVSDDRCAGAPRKDPSVRVTRC